MVLPALLYGIGLWTNQPALGLWLVAGAGVIGFFARQAIFDLILRLYRKRKYETLAAYKFKG